MSYDAEDTGQRFYVCPCQKVKCEIMFFLVNASPLKSLDVATTNFGCFG